MQLRESTEEAQNINRCYVEYWSQGSVDSGGGARRARWQEARRVSAQRDRMRNLGLAGASAFLRFSCSPLGRPSSHIRVLCSAYPSCSFTCVLSSLE